MVCKFHSERTGCTLSDACHCQKSGTFVEVFLPVLGEIVAVAIFIGAAAVLTALACGA